MQSSKSAQRADAHAAAGCLFLVSTPIGNLEDITLRALRVLKEADLIACEDTRRTQKLLNHYGIRRRLVSYHEHNEMTRAAELAIELEQGAKVALVSDAGTPAISDPGQHLVALCRRHSIPVVPVPGASALVAALAASGMPTSSFYFAGFLPSRSGERRKALTALAGQSGTLVFYEAPHRILETLRDAREILGNRLAVLAREVTKLHEEFHRGSLDELLTSLGRREPRGEMTLLVGPTPSANAASGVTQPPAPTASLAARVAEIVRERGVDQKTALKLVARERGITRRLAYKQLLREQG